MSRPERIGRFLYGMSLAINSSRILGKVVDRGMVKKGIIIVSPDIKQRQALGSVLENEDYEPLMVPSLQDAKVHLEKKAHRAVLIDLDFVAVENRFFKELRQGSPSTSIIGLSSRSFHPELQEALSRYIDACFEKSDKFEDLLYWLKAVLDPLIRQENDLQCSKGESLERS